MKNKTPFEGLTDRTPKYTVKEVADKLNMSTYTIRYYENTGLIPAVDRTEGNIRMFSDYNLGWLKLVHCLRTTGLPIDKVKSYIDMCLVGDSTIAQRAELIFQQEKSLRQQLRMLHQQMEILKYKKHYYQDLIANRGNDTCNPQNLLNKNEPNIMPQEK